LHPIDGAKWIGAGGEPMSSMPVFRRAISITRPIARATCHLCGLGQHELQINGVKVGDDLFEPAWSNYAKTCYFVTHDLTPLLHPGEHELRILLGNGMYNVGAGKRYKKFKASFGAPKLIAAIILNFADGSSQMITSDESWQVAPGPITFSCIYGGEDHDARLDHPTNFHPATVVDPPGGTLIAQTSPPIRVMQTINPIKITDPQPGIRVYDLGQNISGRPAIAARGFADQTIKLTTAELLDDSGQVTQKNTGAPVYFTYTLNDNPQTQHWRPPFSYTGFRYIQAEGDIDAIQNLQGEFIYSSAKQVGHFKCSSDLLNRIHELILSAIRSNLQSVITDCPHREKLGWLEQTHLMGDAILFNFDAKTLYQKISADMRDAQLESGCVPTIAPQYTSFNPPWDIFNDSPEWGSAVVINPWLVYQRTGDKAILDENYDAMKRYVLYLRTRETAAGLIDYGLGDWYDIGPGDPGFSKLTSKSLTATAIYYRDLIVLRSTADVLGRRDDSAGFARDAERIRGAFNAELFDAGSHGYDTNSQTASGMPLALGIVDEHHRAAVLENLIADIRLRDNHITAGDIGFHFVIRALAENGRSDVIFDLLSRTDPPSYGAQLARGATTLTEAWDANPKVSQNHLMLGHAEIWFYEFLAGIRVAFSKAPDERITIAPAVVGDLSWAEASYESVLGRIGSRWERNENRLTLLVEIPPDASATIRVPYAADATGVVAGPGKHRFESTLPLR
jgi:alpha-L-rhamnosidase